MTVGLGRFQSPQPIFLRDTSAGKLSSALRPGSKPVRSPTAMGLNSSACLSARFLQRNLRTMRSIGSILAISTISTISSIAALFACSGGEEISPPAFEVTAPRALVPPDVDAAAISPAAPGVAALPVFASCPEGWSQAQVAAGVTACEPWAANARPTCAADRIATPSHPTCAAIGSACAGDFALSLPATGVLYVRPRSARRRRQLARAVRHARRRARRRHRRYHDRARTRHLRRSRGDHHAGLDRRRLCDRDHHQNRAPADGRHRRPRGARAGHLHQPHHHHHRALGRARARRIGSPPGERRSTAAVSGSPLRRVGD